MIHISPNAVPIDLDFPQDRAIVSRSGSPMLPAYDSSNIFAKILRGEAPCTRVYEDDVALAFMDIMPRAEGHLLVIPKTPARNILDMPPAEFARFMPSVQKIAKAAKIAMAADGLSIMQFNEAAGGQVVFHLHFHILPRWTGVELRPPGGAIEKNEKLTANAAKIAAALTEA
jgi:histidine triad (HIT) family protein